MGEPKVICATCGHYGQAKGRNRGSAIVLVFLLFAFIVPGIFYFFYMVTGQYLTCRSCQGREVLSPTTPRGKALLAEYYPDGVPA